MDEKKENTNSKTVSQDNSKASRTSINRGRRGGGPAFARGGEKPKDFRKAMRFLFSYLKPYVIP